MFVQIRLAFPRLGGAPTDILTDQNFRRDTTKQFLTDDNLCRTRRKRYIKAEVAEHLPKLAEVAKRKVKRARVWRNGPKCVELARILPTSVLTVSSSAELGRHRRKWVEFG